MMYIRGISLFFFCCYLLLSTAFAAGSLTEKNYKLLQQIHTLIEAKKFHQAHKQLQHFLSASHDKYTQALFLQTAAQVAIEQEKYYRAITYLKKSYALQALPAFVNQNMAYNIAQLYAQAEKWKKSLHYTQLWLKGLPKEKPLTAEQSIFIATVYAQTLQYQLAIQYVNKAIGKAKKVPESWYQLLLSFYLAQKHYRKTIPIYQKLLQQYPEKSQYWKQLANIYMQLGKTNKALATWSLADKQGLLSEQKEILRLVNLYLYASLPISAAKLLQKKLQAGQLTATRQYWEKLADSWILAQEYTQAITALDKLIQLYPDNAQYAFRKGRLLMEQGEWAKAVVAFQLIQKKSGKNMGHHYLLMGISAYYSKRTELARKAFLTARQYKAYRKQAKVWLEQLL